MSDETRWTPGPWFVSHANDDQAYEIGIQSDHGMKWHVCDICEGCDIDRKANANLIAAAPDGYELAELVMDICGNPKGASEAGQEELYEAALHYAKKARGEQS